ncbi:thioredoxin family protein [Patescibacteria group bacterium]
MKIDWKKLLITISTVIITSVVVGGTMWYGLTSAINEQKSQITSLEKQASELSEIYSEKLAEKKAAEAAEKAAEEKAKEQATTPTYTPEPEPESTPVVTPKIYYFYSPNCGTCTAQTYIVNELIAEEDIPFVFMNVVAHPSYISKYGISAVPTFILNGHKETAYFTKPELLNFWNTYK